MTGAPAPADAVAPEVAPAVPAGVRPWLRRFELAVLGLALLYSLIFWARLPTQLPTDADYAALQAAVQQGMHPGDAAAVLPFWADRVKVYLHGIPILGLPNLDTELDAERYARLWVIAQPALPRSDAADTLVGLSRRMDAQGAPRRFGPLELWLFTPKAGRAGTWDFVAHPGEAQVQANGPVQLQWKEFDFLPRHCFALGGTQASVRFANVQMAHGLRIGIGLQPGSSAQVSATVDGRPLPAFETTAGGPAFQTRELTADGLSPGDHAVEISVNGRGICLDAVAF